MKSTALSYRATQGCRSCGTENLTTVVNLGSQHIVDFVKDPGKTKKPTVPLELVLCEHCNLLQLKHSISPDILYREFWYRSGVNESMRLALQDVVSKAIEYGDLKAGDLVLDVGANDGTLLSMYPDNVTTIGIDPSNQILVPEAAMKMKYAIHDYFNRKPIVEIIKKEKKYCKAITAIAMFYDLEDPAGFLHDAKAVLAEDGLLIIQMNYLMTMLKNNAVDNICHEHITYFSLSSLKWLSSRVGFTIVDVEVNDVNGGTIRVYMKRTPVDRANFPAGGIERIHDLLQEEQEYGLTSLNVYHAFSKRVKDILFTVSEFITKETLKGKVCYGYGASTRGTTYLQCMKVPLSGVAERDQLKVGLRMVAEWLLIHDEEYVRNRADYMLVLPWHFKASIVAREKEWLDKGGKLIFALPIPHVVTKDGEETIPMKSLKLQVAGNAN